MLRAGMHREIASVDDLLELEGIQFDWDWHKANKHKLKALGRYLSNFFRCIGNRSTGSTDPKTGEEGYGVPCDSTG